MANDRELNKWCSLKKAIQYRPEHVEKYEVIAYSRKGQSEDVKRKALPSLFQTEAEDDAEPENNFTVDEDVINNKKLPTNENNHTKTVSQKEKKKQSSEMNGNDATENNDNTKDEKFKKNKKQKSKISVCVKTHNSDNTKEISLKEKMTEQCIEIYENEQSKSNETKVIDVTDGKENKKKRRKKKKPSMVKRDENIKNVSKEKTNDLELSSSGSSFASKKRKRKNSVNNGTKKKQKLNTLNLKDRKKAKKQQEKALNISDARLEAFGINPKKYRNKIKYGNNK